MTRPGRRQPRQPDGAPAAPGAKAFGDAALAAYLSTRTRGLDYEQAVRPAVEAAETDR